MANSENAEAMEQRVMAFAEQLGRIVGTVQAKAEGWMDRDALRKQLAEVRDGAADLLNQLAGDVTKVADDVTRVTKDAKQTRRATATAVAAATAKKQARSGGFVDAPGKKHRKPVPRDARVKADAAKRSNMRSAQASMKTVKLEGGGR